MIPSFIFFPAKLRTFDSFAIVLLAKCGKNYCVASCRVIRNSVARTVATCRVIRNSVARAVAACRVICNSVARAVAICRVICNSVARAVAVCRVIRNSVARSVAACTISFRPRKKDCAAALVFPTGNKYLAPEFSKLSRMENFAAIDFETANREPSSVCSVGVVVVRAGEICDKFYSLIRPEPEYYFYWNTRVHGLTLEDTARAPLFPEVWAKVAPRIEGLPLVAHNSPFDEGCLRARRGLPARRFPDVSDGLSRLRILLYVSRLAPGLRPGIAQPSASDSGGALRLRPQGASPRTGRRRGMCVDSKNNIIKVKNGRRFG